MDDIYRSIASIKAGRAALNWSQKRLAEESNVAMVTIARMECGRVTPNGKTLSKLKKTLELAGVYISDNSPQGGFPLIVTRSEA